LPSTLNQKHIQLMDVINTNTENTIPHSQPKQNRGDLYKWNPLAPLLQKPKQDLL